MVAVLVAFRADAQKIGYVNMQEIVTGMPEYAQADTALGQYQNTLVQEYQAMQQQFQNELNTFVKDSATMSDAVKQVKRGTLQDLSGRISQFQQTMQQQLQQKQGDLLKPIIEKAQAAVSAVAKSKGYTYVMNDSGQGEILVVKPEGDDLTPSVKAKLGLK